MFHRTVMGRGKHESHPRLVDADCDLIRSQIQVDPRRFQDIGAAGLTGHRSIAVFGDMPTGTGNHKGAGGGNVESARPVTTGPTGIDQMIRADLDGGCELAHDTGGRGYLFYRFAFHSQADQKSSNLGWGRFSRHDGPHNRRHLITAQVPAFAGGPYG